MAALLLGAAATTAVNSDGYMSDMPQAERHRRHPDRRHRPPGGDEPDAGGDADQRDVEPRCQPSRSGRRAPTMRMTSTRPA